MIRPVEMQGVVQRSQDVSNIRHEENIKPVAEQVNLHIRQEKEIRQKSEQVIKKDDTARENTKYDAKEKGNNQYYHQEGRENKEHSADEDDGKVIIKQTSRFDASV